MAKHPAPKAKRNASKAPRKNRPSSPKPSPEKVARAVVEAVIDQVALVFAHDE